MQNQSFSSTFDRTAQAPVVDVSDSFFGHFHADSKAISHATFASDATSFQATFSGNPTANANYDANVSGGFADALAQTGVQVSFTIDVPTPFTLSATLSPSPTGTVAPSAAYIQKAGQNASFRISNGESKTISGTLDPGLYSVTLDAQAYAVVQGPAGSMSSSDSEPGSGSFTLGTPGCPNGQVPSVKAGQVLAEGCFAERKDSNGNGTGVFETDEQAWAGGFEVDPAFGGKFVVDTKTPALSEEGAGVDVKIDGITTPIEPVDLPVNTTDGTIDLNQAGTVAKAILNLPVKGKLKVSWSDGGRSSGLDGEVSVKAAFSNFIVATNSKGSEGEFKFKLKQTNKTGLVVNQASAKIDEVSLIPTKFKVPKPLALHNLTATYDRKNGKPLWSFGGLIGLPFFNGLEFGGKLFWSEGPAGGGVAADGIDKEIPDTPFFLQKIDGDLVFKPDFGVSATVGVTFGPRVEGKQVAVLEGNLTSGVLVSSSDCPNGLDPFKIEGKLKLAKLDFTDTLVKLEGTERTCTYSGPIKGADASAKITAEFGGSTGITDMGVEATTSGFIGQTGFNQEGTATLKLPLVPAITGSMIFSNQGIAACGKFNAAFQGGIGYRWGASPPSLFSGCDLSPFRTTALPAGDGRARTAAASQALSVPNGLPVAAFSASAAGRAPRIRVSGPRGESFRSPATGATINDRVVIIPDAAQDTTYVVVTRPSAGRWTVHSLDSAVRLTRVAVANGLPRPHITARLLRHKRKLTLVYRVRPIPGQQVTFTERGAGGVFRTIGRARGARGTLTFNPTVGFERARKIVAEVIDNGLPRALITLARFTAPKPPRLTRPGHLKLKRKSTTLALSWTPVNGASNYFVKVFQGHALVATTITPRNTFTFNGLPPNGKLTVTISALNQLQAPGPATHARTK